MGQFIAWMDGYYGTSLMVDPSQASREHSNRYSWVSCLVGTVTRPPSGLKELGIEFCAEAVPDLSVLEVAVIYFFAVERRGLKRRGWHC